MYLISFSTWFSWFFVKGVFTRYNRNFHFKFPSQKWSVIRPLFLKFSPQIAVYKTLRRFCARSYNQPPYEHLLITNPRGYFILIHNSPFDFYLWKIVDSWTELLLQGANVVAAALLAPGGARLLHCRICRFLARRSNELSRLSFYGHGISHLFLHFWRNIW